MNASNAINLAHMAGILRLRCLVDRRGPSLFYRWHRYRIDEPLLRIAKRPSLDSEMFSHFERRDAHSIPGFRWSVQSPELMH